ncbi:hypothetical protein V8E36_003791 [Tilletia maclaganii]
MRFGVGHDGRTASYPPAHSPVMEPEKKPSASASAASPSSSAAAPPPAPVYLELSPDLLPLDDNEMKIIEEDNAFELEAAVKLEDMGDEGVQHAPMPPTLPAGPPPKATAQSAERSDGVAAFKTAFLKLLRAEMGLDEDGSEWPPFPSDTTRPDQWPRFPPTEQQLAVWNAIPPSQRPPLWTIGKLKLRLAWDLHPTHPSIETYLISLRNRILASPAVYCVDPDLGLEQASVALMQAYTEVRRLGKRANVANKAGVALEAAAASSTTTTTSGTPAAGGSSGPGTKAGTTSDVTPVAAAPGIAVQPPPPRRLAPAASGSGGAAANVATIPPTASSSRAVGATQAIPVPSGATAPMAAATRAAASASSQGANPSRANVYARIAELHALAMNISRSGLATANQTSLPAGAARPAAAGGTSGATATPILAGPSETGKKRVREEREDEGCWWSERGTPQARVCQVVRNGSAVHRTGLALQGARLGPEALQERSRWTLSTRPTPARNDASPHAVTFYSAALAGQRQVREGASGARVERPAE